MLNEAPTNSDNMRAANIVLHMAPNSNNTMRVVNNVHLTTIGTQQFSMAAI